MMSKLTPLYQVGDLVMIRPDLTVNTYIDHYNDDDIAVLSEKQMKYKGVMTEITVVDHYIEEDEPEIIWYQTKIRRTIDDNDHGAFWWIECALVPINNVQVLNQALLNGQINVVAYEQAKQKLGEQSG